MLFRSGKLGNGGDTADRQIAALGEVRSLVAAREIELERQAAQQAQAVRDQISVLDAQRINQEAQLRQDAAAYNNMLGSLVRVKTVIEHLSGTSTTKLNDAEQNMLASVSASSSPALVAANATASSTDKIATNSNQSVVSLDKIEANSGAQVVATSDGLSKLIAKTDDMAVTLAAILRAMTMQSDRPK